MPEQLEGSQAIARAVASCRPAVIPAYPITPQTHIVEALAAMSRRGELPDCEMVTVESEYSALSVAIGACVAGSRTYTATASQGLLYMAEVLPNAAGLGLPIVMTVANRAVGAPINIWNDHSDAMSQRDCGWIQLFATSNQEAVDLHIQAFRLAEALSLPVMVCVDGFILTHAWEAIELPDPDEVAAFVGPFLPRQRLDPEHPYTIGAMVGPDAFTEVRYLAHLRQMQALDLLPEVAAAFEGRFGRGGGGLLRHYRSHDAEVIVVVLGSLLGTVEELVDEMRAAGQRIGAVAIVAFRPWPADEVREALGHAREVIVVEKAFSVGLGGIVSQNVHSALERTGVRIDTVIAGLGGRAITRSSLRGAFEAIMGGGAAGLRFLDLDRGVLERELARLAGLQPSGPHAEPLLAEISRGSPDAGATS